MTEKTGHREILRSSSIIGGASLLNILLGIARTKVLAIFAGPAGVGLVGLYLTLVTTAASLVSMGFGTVGTRQVAEALGRDEATLVAARRALFWGTIPLAFIGGLLVWLSRDSIAMHVLSDASLASDVGWLGLAVALSVGAGSQGALLNGMRRIGDMARLSVLSGLLATVFGVGALWLMGANGLIAFVLAAPLSTFALGYFYVSRVPRMGAMPTPLPMLMAQWRDMLRFGAAYMLTGVIWNCGHLLLRTLVQRDLGLESLGHFQAAWAISMTYIGFVLQAMGADYYPRLTANIRDHVAANQMVNEQTEVALLLAGPVMLAMLGLAPWVIQLLYSDQFSAASSVLRWQILGDILRVAAWPLGYVILAAGDGRKYLFVESSAVALLVVSIWCGLPIFSLEATGIGFLIMYLIYLPILYWLTKKRTGFAWTRSIWLNGALLFFAGLLVMLMAILNSILGALAACVAAGAFGVYAIARLSHMANLTGPLARLAACYRGICVRIGRQRD